MTATHFGVWCCESGGVIWFRSAWLKSNDELGVFDSLDAARREAADLNARVNHSFARRFCTKRDHCQRRGKHHRRRLIYNG
jgi:hypothetical protein